MTRDRYLERQVEKLKDELKRVSAEKQDEYCKGCALPGERESFYNGQMQLQAINNSLMDSISKYAAERKTLRELVDGCMEIVEIYDVSNESGKAWKRDWLRRAREVLK